MAILGFGYQSARLEVHDPSQVGEARRLVGAAVRELGFDETDTGRVAVVTSELATNLVKHGGGGELVVRRLPGASKHGLEVLAIDRGGGIRNMSESLRDGYSTTGTSGTGLGAVQRMSDLFDVWSANAGGTILLARLWPKGAAPRPQVAAPCWAAVCVPKRGQDVTGDGWSVLERQGGLRLLLVDGLGHGPLARHAADGAIRAFHDQRDGDAPADVLAACHDALRGTRGAAVAVAFIGSDGRAVSFTGVGNIAAAAQGPFGSTNMVSMNGIVGQGTMQPRTFEYRLPEDAMLVLASDGIATRWTLGQYPGLNQRDPAIAAALLYRDFARGTDDTTVLVVRPGAPA